MLTVRPVETHYVQQVWPLIESFISDALIKGQSDLDETPDYTSAHVQGFLTAGQWLLVVAVDEENKVHGAATVSFQNYPAHRTAFITAIGGRLISNQQTFEQLKQILRSYGATKIQGYARESIVRLWKRYNFKPKKILIEAML